MRKNPKVSLRTQSNRAEFNTRWSRRGLPLLAGFLLEFVAFLSHLDAQETRLRLSGMWPGFVWGSVTAVATDGSRGYAAVQEGEDSSAMVIFDVSTPSRPLRLGSYPTLEPPSQIVPVSNLVYMVNLRMRGYGLDILDVSNPAFPILRGRYEPGAWSGYGFRVHVAGSYAFICFSPEDGPSVLEVIDVRNAASPVRVGQHALRGFSMGLDGRGQYVYVAEEWSGDESNGFGGLEIFDVSDTSHPVRVGGFMSGATDVQVVGAYAYLAAWTLEVIDVSDPINPVRVGRYATEGVKRVRVMGTSAYVWGDLLSEEGWQVLNLSNPTNPALAATILVEGEARDVAFAGDRAFLAAEEGGLLIADVSNPNHPVPGNNLESASVWDVYVDGHYAYVATGTNLAILNISNPTRPWRAGHYAGGRMFHVSGHRGYLLIAGGTGDDYTNALEIVDMSNPTNLVRLGTYSTELRIDRAQVSGERAYVSQFSQSPTNQFGFEVVSLSNPASPVRLTLFLTNDHIQDVQVSGNYAFVADATNDLRVLDISDAAHPVTVAIYSTNGPPYCTGCSLGAFSVALVSNYVYAAGGDGTHIIDVSNPLRPRSVEDFFSQFPVHGVNARNGYVGYSIILPGFAGGPDPSGVILLTDVSNPTQPVGVGGIGTSYYSTSFDVRGPYFYLAEDGQLLIYEIEKPPALRLSRGPENEVVLEWEAAPGLHVTSAPAVDYEWWMWTEVPGTDGRSRIELPLNANAQFFRLTRP